MSSRASLCDKSPHLRCTRFSQASLRREEGVPLNVSKETHTRTHRRNCTQHRLESLWSRHCLTLLLGNNNDSDGCYDDDRIGTTKTNVAFRCEGRETNPGAKVRHSRCAVEGQHTERTAGAVAARSAAYNERSCRCMGHTHLELKQ